MIEVIGIVLLVFVLLSAVVCGLLSIGSWFLMEYSD
jgi:hypothetical protein